MDAFGIVFSIIGVGVLVLLLLCFIRCCYYKCFRGQPNYPDTVTTTTTPLLDPSLEKNPVLPLPEQNV